MRISSRTVSALVAVVAFSGVCLAEDYEYKEYTVKRGDTLWGISKAELKDNFQWPIIWKENPGVENPDLIYPGQVIRIPVGSLKQTAVAPAAASLAPTAPEEEAAMPAEKPAPVAASITPVRVDPIVNVRAIMENGYIAPTVPYRGKVSHAYLDRVIFATGDDIYINTVAPVEKGQRFYVVRNEGIVRHPVTKKPMGFLIRILGVVEVREAGTQSLKARVTDSVASIEKGDALDDYYEIETPYSIGAPRKPDVKGVVVAARYMKEISGSHEFVFIDRGAADGLEPGDVLATLARGTDDRLNAVVQLVNVRENTSMAFILRGETQVELGDIVTKAE